MNYLDVLDQVAPAGDRVIIGPPPPSLEDLFGIVAAGGWRPRDPCANPAELDTMQYALLRGDCIKPILDGGDAVYIDTNAKPQSGDLVSFRLSQRQADKQNADPPPDHFEECRKGDHWVKLYIRWRGQDMLLERHGNWHTACFMTCESADETPILHPIRAVQRRSKFLLDGFYSAGKPMTRRALLAGAAVAPLAPLAPPSAPIVHASAIVASKVLSAYSGILTNMTSGGGTPSTRTIVSLTLTCMGAPIGIDAYCPVNGSPTAGATCTAGSISIYRDGSALSGSSLDVSGIINAGSIAVTPMTLSLTDTPTPGSHTYSIFCTITGTGGSGITFSLFQSFLKVREYSK